MFWDLGWNLGCDSAGFEIGVSNNKFFLISQKHTNFLKMHYVFEPIKMAQSIIMFILMAFFNPINGFLTPYS